jgi:GAF domain-containing protein
MTVTLSFSTKPSVATDNLVSRMQEQFVQVVLVFIFITAILITALNIAGNPSDAPLNQNDQLALLLAIAAAGLLIFVRARLFTRVIINLVSMLLAAATFAVMNDHQVTLFAVMTLALISAALMAGRLVYLLVNGLVVVRLILHLYTLTSDLPPTSTEAIETLVSILLIGTIPFLFGVLVRYFSHTLRAVALRSQRTADLLEASAAIGQVMSRLLDTQELLNRAVEVIRDRFAFYHVQIFLLDETATYAVLTASTGDIGQQLLARNYRLPANAGNIIGRVVQAGEHLSPPPLEANMTQTEVDKLLYNRRQLALPVRDGDTIIGVLDVYSADENRLSDVEIQTLQIMSNQLATAIRNARLFQAQEQSVIENKRLFLESETNLREIQRLNRQLTRQSWEDYLNINRTINGVTLHEQEFRPKADWTPEMREASQRRRVIAQTKTDVQVIAAPIELRGEVVGAVEVVTPSEMNTEDIQEMMQAIAGRLAVSLDNARLFEETQEATAQEQRVGEIVSQYQSAATVDDLLQITVLGLAETLGAEQASVRLGNLPAAPLQRQNGETA